MDEIQIRAAEPSQQAAIARLAEDTLGEGACVAQWFAQPPERRILLTASQNGELVGFHYAYWCSLGQALVDLGVAENTLGPDTLLVGVPKAIAVRPEQRRQGLAARLLTAGVEGLWAQDPALLLTCAWRMGKTVAMEPVLRRLGFSYWQELLHPWLEAGLYCTYCQSVRCQCNGALFLRRNKAMEEKG